jgi:hypothetical protein
MPSKQRQTFWAIAAGILAAAGFGAALPLLSSSGRIGPAAGVIGLAALILVLSLLPLKALGPTTLVATLLIPMQCSLFPVQLRDTAYGMVPLAIWLIRSPNKVKDSRATVISFCLGLWLLLSFVAAPFHSNRGLLWLAAAGVCLLWTASPRTDLSALALRNWFLRITGPIAAYGVLEGYLFHRNVLFAFLFRGNDWFQGLQYSASYRITTILGHPLMNATVFAVAATLAVSELVSTPNVPLWKFGRWIVFLGALLATHSRGPAIAAAVGTVLVLVFARAPERHLGAAGWRRAAVLVLALCAGLFIVAGLAQRNSSSQGQASAEVRLNNVSEATAAVSLAGPSGAGPGQAEQFRQKNHLPGAGTGLSTAITLENGYLELLVSTGYPGLVLTLWLFAYTAWVGLRWRSVAGEAAALMTLLIALAGFDSIDTEPGVLVLFALFSMAIRGTVALESGTTRGSRPTSGRTAYHAFATYGVPVRSKD